MAKISNEEVYKRQIPLNPQATWVGNDPVTGKTITISASSLLGQIFNLELLGQRCIDYPKTTLTDCDTGEEIEVPLQIVQVLLKHEELICELLNNYSSFQSNCNITEVYYILYDENVGEPNEWNVSERNNNSGIVLGNNTNSTNGSLNISINQQIANIKPIIDFNTSNPFTVEDLYALSFFIDNENSNPFKINIKFTKNGLSINDIEVFSGLFNFNNNNVGYNQALVPLQNSSFLDLDFDKISLEFISLNDTDLIENIFIDEVKLIKRTFDCSNITGAKTQKQVVSLVANDPYLVVASGLNEIYTIQVYNSLGEQVLFSSELTTNLNERIITPSTTEQFTIYITGN